MAYTYLLHHLPTDTFYYGVRWKKGCDSSEFWVKYFTSSEKLVPLYRTLFGDDSFEFEIRRVFEDRMKAVEWEHKVLRRMKVLEHPEKWLNRTDNRSIFNEVNPRLGCVVPEEQKQRQRLKMLGNTNGKFCKTRPSFK